MAWAFLGPSALVWVFSIRPTADLLMALLENNFPVPSEFQADVIIMLGGSAYLGVEDLSGTGAPGPGTMERLVTAARLQRRLDIPIILSGGRFFSISASSAWLARRFLLDLGIPENRIIVESKSRDTYENALFSRNICRQYGFKSPLLVSSGYHLKRAMLSFTNRNFCKRFSIWTGKKIVRVKDIAKRMDVKMPTETSMLRTLNGRGLVNYEKYEYVALTKNGKIIGREMRRRHKVLYMYPAESPFERYCKTFFTLKKNAAFS